MDFSEALPFLDQAPVVHLSPGHFICMEGDRCGHLPLVISGTARVYKISEDGHEITLYRIEPGEGCILTASCILSEQVFPAFAVAETAIEARVIPTSDFRTWFDTQAAWRTYIFDLLARRFSSVIELVEEVAFERMDQRLASYLLDATRTEPRVIERTHEQIALDLGTSREVVSRILKEFERLGWITLMRGAIRIGDRVGLMQRAHRH